MRKRISPWRLRLTASGLMMAKVRWTDTKKAPYELMIGIELAQDVYHHFVLSLCLDSQIISRQWRRWSRGPREFRRNEYPQHSWPRTCPSQCLGHRR